MNFEPIQPPLWFIILYSILYTKIDLVNYFAGDIINILILLTSDLYCIQD